MCRTVYPSGTECPFFLSTHGVFTQDRRGSIHLKRTETERNVFSDHNRTELEITNDTISRKIPTNYK